MSNKSNKSNKSNDSALVLALLAAVENLRNMPAPKPFDGTEIKTALETAGLPESFINNALRESEKKYLATHGDTEENALRAALSALSTGMSGGIAQVSLVAGRMATEERNRGKVTFTGSQWEDAIMGKPDAKPDAIALVAKAKSLRVAGKPWSEIETTLNLSESSRQALYTVAKDRAEFKSTTTEPAAA